MHKLRFLFLLMLLPSMLYAQQRTKINLLGSETINVVDKNQMWRIKKPIFEHDGAILTCDSARYWIELNYFEAFGNVHINQDTINIYSDLLNYDGNAKMAHLMNRVRMSDPSSVLTTNIFDYNMVTRVGTYIDNGKIENRKEGTTVVSKKGYYLSSTKDAYFRYNVVVVTDSVTIKSDSLRYNTFTNQTYFYGPTDIKGKNDNLYTENGEYNTKTKKAFFGKKNLYTQGTKSLKGDSLYYDGIKGYGRAVKNIVFIDTQDKFLLKAQLGEYYKETERIVATKNAYLGMGTSDSITVAEKLIPDTLWLGADVLESERALQKSLTIIKKPIVLKDNEVGTEDEKEDPKVENTNQAVAPIAPTPEPGTPKPGVVTKPAVPAQAVPNPSAKPTRKQSKKDKEKEKKEQEKEKVAVIDSLKNKIDTLKTLPDSVKSILKIETKKDSLVKDSLLKSKKPLLKDTVKLALPKAGAKPNATKMTPSKNTDTTKQKLASPLSKPVAVKDTIPFNPADTVRTRTIRAYHHVQVYKSNLQAKSDSLFFTAADSTLRLYQNPMLWTDSAQQTGDTIHVQFKDKKINSAQVLQNAFIADQETDTTKFNQIKGKIITAFFNQGEIRNMYVDGNAESISYEKKKDGEYQQNQTLSARLKITFLDKEIESVTAVKGIEGTFSPPNKVAKEGILTGFVWKPELRPKSKEDIIKGSPDQASVQPIAPGTKTKATTPKSTVKKPAAKPASNTTPKKPVVVTKDEKIPVKADSAKTILKPVVEPVKIDTNKKN